MKKKNKKKTSLFFLFFFFKFCCITYLNWDLTMALICQHQPGVGYSVNSARKKFIQTEFVLAWQALKLYFCQICTLAKFVLLPNLYFCQICRVYTYCSVPCVPNDSIYDFHIRIFSAVKCRFYVFLSFNVYRCN